MLAYLRKCTYVHLRARCPAFQYPADKPLLFNVCVDPSEGIPLAGALPDGTFVSDSCSFRLCSVGFVRSRINVGAEIRISIDSK